MLTLHSQVKIYLHSQPVDMRKSFDGLFGLVKNDLGRDAREGGLFMFLNLRRNRIKLMYFETDGLCIWSKRLECGCFQRPLRSPDGKHVIIDVAELQSILSGIDLSSIRQRRRFGLLRNSRQFVQDPEKGPQNLYRINSARNATTIRPATAIVRKNWLFVGNMRAGMRNAALMSLVASAQRNNLDVQMYLESVITHMVRAKAKPEELLQDVWKTHHPEAVRVYREQVRREKAASVIEQATRRRARS